jgi:ABC-type lipoprotein release transport system permease subunit
VLGIAGVVAVGALLFDMLMLSRGLMVSFRDLLSSVGYDVRITATPALPTLGPPIAGAKRVEAALAALPELEEATPLRLARAEALPASGSPVALSLFGTRDRARGMWTLIRGEGLGAGAAEGPPALVINRNLAERLGAGPGARLRLRADAGAALPPVEFRVAGIAAFAFETSSEALAATTLAACRRLEDDPGGGPRDAGDEADLFLVASRPGIGALRAVAAIEQALPDLHAFSNEQLLDRFQRTDFSYFRQISLVLTAVTLFFAFLLVATLLTVTVNQRYAEIAALRALGFSRRRIVADLVAESALLVGAGGLLALPAGGLLAARLDALLRTMPWIPERLHFFVFEPRTLVLHLLLLQATGLAAALYPVWLAARLPITATLRREVVS